MEGIILNVIIIITEVICALLFFDAFAEASKRKCNIVCVVALAVLSYGVSVIFEAVVPVKLMVMMLLYAVSMGFCYTIRWKKLIVLVPLFFAILLMVDYLAYAVMYPVFASAQALAANNMLDVFFVVLIDKWLLFFVVMIIRKSFKKAWKGRMDTRGWLAFMALPVCTLIALVAMFVAFQDITDATQRLIIFVTAFILVVINVVVFLLMNKMFAYQHMEEVSIEQRKRIHEFKNEMLCISSLVKRGELEKLNEYISKVNDELRTEDDVINTNSTIVNAVVNTKYHEMTGKGITFVMKINDMSNIRISDEDMVVIVSNLLNNAIEACEQCEGEKIVRLKLEQDDNYLVIATNNTYSTPIVKRHNEIISTKSTNGEKRGSGLKNIISIVEKYKGDYDISYDDKEFRFVIMIYNY